MPMQWGPTKIGAMQYNGVTIGEAMMDGQIVYRSTIYPLTGTFEVVNGAPIQAYEVFSHTVVEPGDFTGTVTQESGEVTAYSWTLNGGSQTTGLTRTFTGLSVGDTIQAQVLHFYALNVSGTWSLVKNP